MNFSREFINTACTLGLDQGMAYLMPKQSRYNSLFVFQTSYYQVGFGSFLFVAQTPSGSNRSIDYSDNQLRH